MKKNIIFSGLASVASAVCLVLVGMVGLQGCSETIDTSNYAVKTEQTMADFFIEDADYSDMKAIFDRVRLGRSEDASSLTSVLSARGNYTCFVANNEAVRNYVESLTGSRDVASLSDEQAELIAYNCLIDNGDESAYESPDFPQSGSFAKPALSNRLLICEYSNDLNEYVINSASNVIKSDYEVSNGMIHFVDHVIAPSQDNVADMIMAAGNMKVMSALLTATTWCDSMTLDRDLTYDEVEREETVSFTGVYDKFPVVDSRYQGYTAFVETDDVFVKWGIPAPQVDESTGEILNSSEIVAAVESKCQSVYGSEALGDYSNPDNPVNQFVAYHILPGKIAYNRFVHHFNEYLYQYGTIKEPVETGYTVNVWDYYTTMGKYRGLMKITQVPLPGYGIFINRVSTYDNEPQGSYQELSFATGEGLNIQISSMNGEYDNNALNGYYYPIDNVLLYNDLTRQKLGSERIRVDITTMLPEMASNNCRGTNYYYFPNGYFNNITNETSDTRIFYLQCGYGNSAPAWNDFQGDEFLFAGLYDFVLKLPPVPIDQTYELRMGVAQNSLRGMAQIYIGDDPQNLVPVGLPFDMRQTAINNPSIPWVQDGDDETVNRENDKNMRNQGYMKGPKYFTTTNGKGTDIAREYGAPNPSMPCLRRIVTVQRFEPGKTYYLRFKSALEDRNAQFFVDYFEFVPTIVYNGPDPEDIW